MNKTIIIDEELCIGWVPAYLFAPRESCISMKKAENAR
jgi:hypothetical protein